MNPQNRLETAAELMRSRRIGSVPVVAETHLHGIITRSDVLDAYLKRKPARPSGRDISVSKAR